MTQENIAAQYFSSAHGFGEHKKTAIDLLKKTIEILEEYNINYFLVSGTLLGHVRHNGFIPWDDDIDLAVDSTILDKLSDMNTKYGNQLNFITKDKMIVKTCFKDVGNIIKCMWQKFMLNKNENYRWPFIDLFIYQQYDDKINFFNKNWTMNEFFPVTKIKFYDIDAAIPRNPDYFLKINFKDDYMTKCIASTYNHRLEKSRVDRTGKHEMSLEDVLKFAAARGDVF